MKKIIVMFLMVGATIIAKDTELTHLNKMKTEALERLKDAEKTLDLAMKTGDLIAIKLAENKVSVELKRFEIANQIYNEEIYYENLKKVIITIGGKNGKNI